MTLRGNSATRILILLPMLGILAKAGTICGYGLNGPNWVNSCPEATHVLSSDAYMSGQIDGNPFTLVVSGTVSVWTGAGAGLALTDEIYDMYLTAPGVTVIAGDGVADGVQTAGPRAAFYTGGTITQQGNEIWADSVFNVFLQLTVQTEGGPLVLHNNVAQQTNSVTDQLPPVPGTGYGDPTGTQIPIETLLYDSTNQLRGFVFATPQDQGGAAGGFHMVINPEPATWLLLGSALTLLGARRRRSR